MDVTYIQDHLLDRLDRYLDYVKSDKQIFSR